MNREAFVKSVLSGLCAGFCLCAVAATCQGCAYGDGERRVTTFQAEPEAAAESAIAPMPACTLELAVGPNIQTATARATARITAATGCTFTASDDGIPVSYGEMRAVDGGVACGQNANTYDENGIVLTEDAVTVATNYQDLVAWSASSILVHELMHALINQPGQNFDTSHAASGIFAAHTEPGGDVLNADSLSYFCARAACTDFAPEPTTH